MWWKRKLDMHGSVFFRGELPPALGELHGLRAAGVAIIDERPRKDEIWRAALRHPQWGDATLSNRRDAEPIPRALVESSPGFTEAERERVLQLAESSLQLELKPTSDDSLRERKRLLRFMAAVLDRDGIVAADVMAQTLWSENRLHDEIAHDAPLDIIHVHVLHVVMSDDESSATPVWVHSHGLGEMGFVDFDVMRPAPELTGEQFDVLRSIAFSIVEGTTSGEILPVLGGDPVVLVDAEVFMAEASEADRRLRDAEFHTESRVVCCDPRDPGLFRRLLGRASYRPSQMLSRGLIEGRHLVSFSSAATELTAERARETLHLFERYRVEFEDLECTAIAKMGYPTDSGSDANDREHLWFEVHGVTDGGIDATLLNDPFDVAELSAGQRAQHPIELLTDWTVVTPLGQLTPRTLEVARQLREARPRILEALEEMRAAD